MQIEQHVWGFTPESASGDGGGLPVILYTMTNSHGAKVQLTNYGATIVGISVPDRYGKMADIVLGYDQWQSYIGDGPGMGKSVGRYANRIAKGKFELGGKTYQLAVNNGPNHLHGGPTGFQNRVWEGRVEGDRVVFGYRSENGEEGYPGAVYVEACYDWDDEDQLEITYYGRLIDDEPGAAQETVLNLTNHVYFNLKGHNQGDILDHVLTLHATEYLPTDDTAIPLPSASAPVEGTPMDFREPHTIGERIGWQFDQLIYGKGYDHCWVIDNYPARDKRVLENKTLLSAGELYSPDSGRYVKVRTTQPGIQVYTGNWLSGSPAAKKYSNIGDDEAQYGHVAYAYEDRFGVAMECQAFPDTPNRPDFPGVTLRAGEVYEQHIVYQFGSRDSETR